MKASVPSVSELIINMYVLLQHESPFEGRLKKIKDGLFKIQISSVSSKMLHYFMIISTAVYSILKIFTCTYIYASIHAFKIYTLNDLSK